MIKDYGMLAGNSKRKAPFQQDKDDHIMRLKRVPMSLAQKHTSGYKVLMSDIASPGESRFAYAKLRKKENMGKVLERDRRQKEKLLEHRFKLSPANMARASAEVEPGTARRSAGTGGSSRASWPCA